MVETGDKYIKMTKYYLEVLETKLALDGKTTIEVPKTSIEKLTLIEAQTAKQLTPKIANEIIQIHVCKHGDGVKGNNLPCEVV